ncbi:MAG: hypothetical protein ACREVK_01865 [Gammaproteobacteria bacterium]
MIGTINTVKGNFYPSRPARRALKWMVPWFLSLPLSGCEFKPPVVLDYLYPLPLEDTPLSPIDESEEQMVFEDPGNMVIFHGFACAVSNQPDKQKVLRVEQSRTLATALDRATVFLNGWRFEYLKADHKVLGLGMGIFKIRREGNVLKWQAFGSIGNDNFDDPYRWCYNYTLVAWNPSAFAAGPDHRDDHAFQGENAAHSKGDIVDDIAVRWETALSFHPNYIDTSLTGYYFPRNAAILPRGFAFVWYDGDEFEFDEHNLLQVAYNLDHSERFIADGKRYVGDRVFEVGGPDATDQVATPRFSWETKTIFKDNDLKRDYAMGEIVSVLAGPGVGVVQPPFTVVPVEDKSNCIPAGGSTPAGESRIISRVPFDVAVPVLTGWDLSYPCDGQRVEAIGTGIQGFNFTRPAGGAGAVLDYTLRSVLRDKDGGDGHRFRHRVSILGFNRTVAQFIVLPATATIAVQDSRELTGSANGFPKRAEWRSSDPQVAELRGAHPHSSPPAPGMPLISHAIRVRCLKEGQATITAMPVDPALQTATATITCG